METTIKQQEHIPGAVSGEAMEVSSSEAEAANEELTALLAATGDAIFRVTEDGRIARWFRGAEQLFGCPAERMIGQPLTALFPPERAEEITRFLRRVLGGETVNEPLEIDCAASVSAAWAAQAVSITSEPVRDETGNAVGAWIVARDLAPQQQARDVLQALQTSADNRMLVLEAANRVALDILSRRAGVEALSHIAEAARALSGARYAALGVARPDGRGLTEFVTVGMTAEQEAAVGPRPMGKGILGMLLRRSEPLRIDALSQHPHSVGFPPNHPPMETFLGVPIRRGDTVLGSLYLTEKEGGGSFTEADVTAVEALGAYAAVAIHNLHMLSRQRSLVSGLITAQEEERRAVAYDLHDGLTQFVMASHAHLEAFRRAHEAGREDRAARELDQGLRYLKEAVVESRRLVNGLRSLALDDLGLAGAMEQLVADEKKRAGWEDAEFIHNVADRRFDKMLETAAYRVAQEALTNARKHAGTSHVRVMLITEGEDSSGHLILEVRDWGRGFVVEEQTGEMGQVGLQSMVERVRLLDGQYELTSVAGEGTRIQATFPLLEPQPDGAELGAAAAGEDSRGESTRE